jgi:hypothetical protein
MTSSTTSWFLARVRGEPWLPAEQAQVLHWRNLVSSDGDEHARALLAEDAAKQRTVHIVDAAIAHGHRSLRFDDGTTMTASSAYRDLARREAVAVHTDLRRWMTKAMAPDVRALRLARQGAEQEGVRDDDDGASFLRATTDAAEAAWDVLLRIGKGRERGAMAAARLLDLPDVPAASLCSPVLIRAAVRTAVTLQAKAMQRPIRAVRSPPLLTGTVVTGDDAITLLVAEQQRMDLLLRSLRGVAQSLMSAMLVPASSSTAMTMALLQPSWLRALGVESAAADWLWRVGTATTLLQVRAAVAMRACIGLLGEERTEMAMTALMAAMGDARVGDPPELLREQLLMPALLTGVEFPEGAPGGSKFISPCRTLQARADHARHGARQWLRVRDELSELPWLHPRLSELPWPTTVANSDNDGPAWSQLMGEVS